MSTAEIRYIDNLIFLLREGEVLLGVKTRKVGAGLWNGYGGKIKPGEIAREAASRELEEECGLITDPANLIKVGMMDFHNVHQGQRFIARVHIFLAYEWHGEVKETAEMATPTWFPINNLPLNKLMPADPDWLPLVLAGQKIVGEAFYDEGQKNKIAPTIIRPATDEELIKLED